MLLSMAQRLLVELYTPSSEVMRARTLDRIPADPSNSYHAVTQSESIDAPSDLASKKQPCAKAYLLSQAQVLQVCATYQRVH
jgi:hypothetical protein